MSGTRFMGGFLFVMLCLGLLISGCSDLANQAPPPPSQNVTVPITNVVPDNGWLMMAGLVLAGALGWAIYAVKQRTTERDNAQRAALSYREELIGLLAELEPVTRTRVHAKLDAWTVLSNPKMKELPR